MRFLVDECVPRELATRLAEIGHDVVFVPEVARSEPDNRVAALATEQGRVVITQDYDFGWLAESGLTPNGVILIAPMPDLSPRETVLRGMEALAEEGESLGRRITVVERRRIRRRPLPVG